MRWIITMIAWVWALMVSAQTPVLSDSIPMAENFKAVTAEGRVVELDSLPKGRLTILVFFDPDCSNCRQVLFGLKHSSLVKQLIEEEVLQVLTVHVGYEERLWRDMLGDMPEIWTKTTTTFEMLDGKCYDLSSMPALYLLDADRKIMMRSSYAEDLTEVLYKLW